ncbi:MAG: DUF5723 family protein [Porphyromonas sp.]|nr:DUF5723 family protein [Porphyromonas sp.]
MKNYIYRILSALGLIAGCLFSIKAQHSDHTLLATDADFARISQNPSYIPVHDKVIVGLPLISHLSTEVHLPSAPNSIIFKDANGTYIVLDKAIRALADRSFFTALNADLFSLGIKGESGFYSLNIGMRADVMGMLNAALADFAVKGNAHYMGKDTSLGHIPVAHRRYLQAAFGYANDKILESRNLRLGARLKFITMASGAFSDGGDFVIRTDDKGRSIRLSGKQHYLVNNSGAVKRNAEGDIDMIDLGKGMLLDRSFANYGLGVDLGAEYILDKQWSFGLSVTDLGFIHWNRENLKSVELDLTGDKEIEFQGVNFSNALLNKEQGRDPYFDKLIRDLESALSVRSADRSYTSSLYTRIGATAEYTPVEEVKVKALLGGTWIGDRFHHEAVLSSSYRPGSFFTAAVSVSSMRSTPFSLGGAVVLGDGFQTILAVDNLLALDYTGVNRTAVRLGINFRF